MPSRASQTTSRGRAAATSQRKQDLVYAVKRGTQVPVNITATDSGRAANFLTLTSLPNYTEFANLFDQFTFDAIEVEFVLPRAAISTGNTGIFPTLVYALDYNDSVSPVSVNDVLQYDGCKVIQFSEAKRSHKFVFKPKAPVPISSGTANLGSPMWLSTSDAAGAIWYGFKYWLQDYNSTASNGSIVTMYVTYHARYRVPK